jgi:group I intron endonuclease
MINAHIYMVTNNLNGKQYVGQSTIERNKIGHGQLIKLSYDKYGKNNFTYIPICKNITNRNTLNYLERFWIKVINTQSPNGYNLEEGGSSKGEMAKSTKEKLRKANLEKKLTEKTKAKIAIANTGRFPSEETKAKLRESRSKQKPPMLGKKISDETKKKISDTKKGEKNPFFGKNHSEETKLKFKDRPVVRHWLGKKLSDQHKAHLILEKTCPHCSKIGKGNAMIRWHMDNCKSKG